MNKSKHVPSYSLYHHICCNLNKTRFSYHFVSLPRQILVLILNYQTSNFYKQIEIYALQERKYVLSEKINLNYQYKQKSRYLKFLLSYFCINNVCQYLESS